MDVVGLWVLGTDPSMEIDMTAMFEGATGITDLNGLATKPSKIFPGKTAWDVSRVTSMERMFAGLGLKDDPTGTRDYIWGARDSKGNFVDGTDWCMQLDDATGIASWRPAACTNFKEMFANDILLATLDISGWDTKALDATNSPWDAATETRSAVDVTDMLYNLAGLKSITLSHDNVLAGTGLDERVRNAATATDATMTRQYTDGSWRASDASYTPANDLDDSHDNLWSGRTNALVDLYPAAGPQQAPTALATYTWDGAYMGGIFPSSKHAYTGADGDTYYHYYAWWKFNLTGDASNPNYRTLTIGAIGGTGAAGLANNTVTEYRADWGADATDGRLAGEGLSADANPAGAKVNTLPWMPVDGVYGSYDAYHTWVTDRLRKVETDGGRGLIAPVRLTGWFYDNNELVSFEGASIDTSQTVSTAYMFYSDEKLADLAGMGEWDVSHVTDLSHMFHHDRALTQESVDILGGWGANPLTNTVAAKDMSHMFDDVDQLNNVKELASWNTASVEDMSYMFANDEKLTDQTDINAWNVSRVRTMQGMFSGDSALATVDISAWEMKPVAGQTFRTYALTVDDMFAGCKSLGQITLGAASVLMRTSFNDALSNRGPTDGRWNLVEAKAPGASSSTSLIRTTEGGYPWFGTTGKLAERYDAATVWNGAGYNKATGANDILTYVWDPRHLGGRFESNPFAWWSYDKDPSSLTYKILTLGVSGHSATDSLATPYVMTPADVRRGANYGFNINEHNGATTNAYGIYGQPWRYATSINNPNGTSDVFPVLDVATDITSVVTLASDAGDKLLVDSPASWFADWKALVSFDGSGMDVTNATSLANLWSGDSNLGSNHNAKVRLTTVDANGRGWTTTNVTDMSGMLRYVDDFDDLDDTGIYKWDVSNVRKLDHAFANMADRGDKKATTGLVRLDLTRFNLVGGDVTGMVEGDVLLEELWLSDTMVMDGSKLSTIATRTATDGMWVRDGSTPQAWFGNGGALEALYPTAGNNYGNNQHYVWDLTRLGGRWASNPWAWWYYTLEEYTDPDTGKTYAPKTLVMGIDDEPATLPTGAAPYSQNVTETYDELPWVKDPQTGNVVVARKDIDHMVSVTSPDGTKRITPKSAAGTGDVLKYWFKDYTALQDFDGTGLRITAANITSLEGLFQNDPALKTLTGLDATEGTGTPAPVWDVSAVTTMKDLFRGDTKLARIDAVSDWKTGSLTNLSGAFAGTGIVDLTDIANDVNDLSGWDVSGVTDYSELFAGALALATVDLSPWDMRAATNRTDMLKNVPSLKKLTLADNTTLAGANLEWADGNHKATDGTWARTDLALPATWWGSSQQLEARYTSAATNGGNTTGHAVYEWDTRFLGGRFEGGSAFSEESAWWWYSREAVTDSKGVVLTPQGTLMLGADGTGTVNVSETYTQLPWLATVPLDRVYHIWTDSSARTTGDATSGKVILPGRDDFTLVNGKIGLPQDSSYWFSNMGSVSNAEKVAAADRKPSGPDWHNNPGTGFVQVSDDTVRVKPQPGHETIYVPVTLVKGKAYQLSFDYSIGNTYTGTSYFGVFSNAMYGEVGRAAASGSVVTLPRAAQPVTHAATTFIAPYDGTFYLGFDGSAMDDGQDWKRLTLRNVSLYELPAAAATLPGTVGAYVNLTDFDGSGLDTTRVQKFTGMFEHDQQLATISGTGSWKTPAAADFSRMFAEDGALIAIDMTDWNMRGSATTAASTKDMFANNEFLRELSVDAGVVLEGGALENVISLSAATGGNWYLKTYSNYEIPVKIGPTTDLINLYLRSGATATQRTTRATFVYRWKFYGTFPSNPNVWWEFDDVTHKLSMGVIDSTKSATVEESGEGLPWRQVVRPEEIQYVVTERTAKDGYTKLVSPKKLTDWFADHEALLEFDGKGLDVAWTTDFQRMFKNANSLQNLDISTWDMVSGGKVGNSGRTYDTKNGTLFNDMLLGTTGLKEIVIGDYGVLANTGLASTKGRTKADGAWKTGTYLSTDHVYDSGDTIWFDTPDHLMTRFAMRTGASGYGSYMDENGYFQFDWVKGSSDNIGPANGGNNNPYWVWDEENKTIWIGAGPSQTFDQGWTWVGQGAAADKVVGTFYTPWGWSVADQVEQVITLGNVHPTTLRQNFFGGLNTADSYSYWNGWTNYFSDPYYQVGTARYQHYKKLWNFDGSGTDVSGVSDFVQFLAYLPALREINLRGWTIAPEDNQNVWNSNTHVARGTFQFLVTPSSTFDKSYTRYYGVSNVRTIYADNRTSLDGTLSTIWPLMNNMSGNIEGGEHGRWVNIESIASASSSKDDHDATYVDQYLTTDELVNFYRTGDRAHKGQTNNHGLNTWVWTPGTVVSFERVRDDAAGQIAEFFLKKGETFYLPGGPDEADHIREREVPYSVPVRAADGSVKSYELYHIDGYVLKYWTDAYGTDAYGRPAYQGNEYKVGAAYTGDNTLEHVTFYARWYRDVPVIAHFVVDDGSGVGPTGRTGSGNVLGDKYYTVGEGTLIGRLGDDVTPYDGSKKGAEAHKLMAWTAAELAALYTGDPKNTKPFTFSNSVEFSRPGYEICGWYWYTYDVDPSDTTKYKWFEHELDLDGVVRLYQYVETNTSEDPVEIWFLAKWAPVSGYTVIYDTHGMKDELGDGTYTRDTEGAIYTPAPRTGVSFTDRGLIPEDWANVKREGWSLRGWYATTDNSGDPSKAVVIWLGEGSKDPSRIDANTTFKRLALAGAVNFADSGESSATGLLSGKTTADVLALASTSRPLYLYAIWEIGKVTLTYTSAGNGEVRANKLNNEDAKQGDTVTEEVRANNGNAAMGAMPIPAPGYEFDYWSNDRTGMIYRHTTGTDPTADSLDTSEVAANAFDGSLWHAVTFTAHFKPIAYTVRFAAGYTGSDEHPVINRMRDRTYTYATNFLVPRAGDRSTIYREGYVFDGWTTDEETPRDLEAGWTLDGTERREYLLARGEANRVITLTARWKAAEATFTYYTRGKGTVSDGTTTDTSVSVSFERDAKSFASITAKAAMGYDFKEWRATKSGRLITITADPDHPATITSDDLKAYLDDPVYDADLGLWVSTFSITAVFSPSDYYVIYKITPDDAQGPANLTGREYPQRQSKTYGRALRLRAVGTTTITRDGYAFTGWNTSPDGTGEHFADGALVRKEFAGYNENTVWDDVQGKYVYCVYLYPEWKATTYTVWFYKGANDATGYLAPRDYTYGTPMPLPTYDETTDPDQGNYRRNGYVFKGWSTRVGESEVGTNEVDLVSFDADGNKTTRHVSEVLDPAALVSYLGKNGQDIALYAVWARKESYDVTFELFSGTEGGVEDTISRSAAMLTDKATAGTQVKPGTMLGTDYANEDLWTQTAEQQSKFSFSHWSYTIVFDDGTTKSGVTQDPRKIAVLGTVHFYAHFNDADHFTIVYEPGEHGTWEQVINKTYYTRVNAGSAISVFGGADTSKSTDYFDTVASNPKNNGKPKGEQGYVFLGWHVTVDGVKYSTWADETDADYTKITYEELIQTKTVTSSLYFTALWKATPTTVYLLPGTGKFATGSATLDDDLKPFVLGAEKTQATATINVGTELTLPGTAVLSHDGYRFVGWDMDGDGEADYAAGAKVKVSGALGGMRFTAIWHKLSFVVHYDSNGGTSVDDKQGVAWDDPNLLPIDVPVKPGYSFEGWYVIDPESGDFDETVAKVNNQLTFADLARENYAKDPRVLLNSYADATAFALANGGTLYAKWVENTATVNYKPVLWDDELGQYVSAPGINIVSDPKLVVDVITGTPKPVTATAGGGYTFKGWYDVDGNLLQESPLDFVPPVPDFEGRGAMWGDETHSVYYAVFAPASYTVEFDPNGGIGYIPPYAATYDVAGTLPKNDGRIARVGFDFLGWNTAADGSGSSYADGAAFKNITTVDGAHVKLYAQWNGRVFGLELDGNGGAVNKIDADLGWVSKDATHVAQDVKAGTAVRLPDTQAFTRAGYEFDGFARTPDGDVTYLPGDLYWMDGAPTTLYAHWEPIRYIVRLQPGSPDASGSMADVPMGFDHFQALPLNTYQRSGYYFWRWRVDVATRDLNGDGYADFEAYYGDGATLPNLTYTPHAVVALVAEWTPKQNKVDFDAKGGTLAGVANPQQVLTGSYADTSRLSVAAPAGSILLGWDYVMTPEYANPLTGTVADPGTLKILGPTTFTAHYVTGDADHRVVAYLPGKYGAFLAFEDGKTLFTDLKAGQTEGSFKYAGATQEVDGKLLPAGIVDEEGNLLWVFAGWLREATGAGGRQVGESVYYWLHRYPDGIALPSIGTDEWAVTLTALWSRPDITVKFHSNGATWASDSDYATDSSRLPSTDPELVEIPYVTEETFTMPGKADFTHQGYRLEGWATSKELADKHVVALKAGDRMTVGDSSLE